MLFNNSLCRKLILKFAFPIMFDGKSITVFRAQSRFPVKLI